MVVSWWLLIFADRTWVCGGGCWVFPIDLVGLWWWLLGFTDRFRGFVVVVAVGFKVVYEIVGFVRAVGYRCGCGGCW